MRPLYSEGIDKINEALKLFSVAIDAAAKAANARIMAKYKASGKMMELDKMEALAAARTIADTFNGIKDFKDKKRSTGPMLEDG